ncbi:hypothetical protein TSAR_012050 [Trichomalopsis sarcophagae]|uniref:RRM domain-containing protein n=1 Tax=Trichomalopsis sarcophagae TaxID=543379 RepID=A0A232F4Q8_9HYME|nr:hypothetical protein TSAR_012050 [Trichomalopsis sarcophagae]
MNQNTNESTENLIQMDSKNCYCILFPNYKKLDLATIEDIFSNYGRVISVTAAGNERGYRFVRYPSREEAQRAVDNVASDYDIHLKSHKPKNQLERQSKSYKKYLKSIEGQRDESVEEFKRPSIPVWEYEVHENHSDSGSYSSNESKDKTLYFVQKSSSTNSSPGSENSDQLRSTVSEERMNQRYYELENPKQQVVTPSDSECVPDLVSTKDPEKHMVVLTAGEVVVGNIPTRLGGAFLLHLFDRHHPIAISYLQPVPRVNARYCHVYFRSDKEAQLVEREFDQYDLMGRRLVVMRPEKLVRFGAM